MRIEVSVGEIADKLTILEIKQERIGDPDKRENIERELALIAAAWDEINPTRRARMFYRRLSKVNTKLWDIEDRLRQCERAKSFGSRFIRLARSVYRLNDGRADLKREINIEMDSELIEEKSYSQY